MARNDGLQSGEAAEIIVPFMLLAPSKAVGGWRFVPWDEHVAKRVDEQHRPYYLDAAKSYYDNPDCAAAAKAAIQDAGGSAVELADVMEALAYAVSSNRRAVWVLRESYAFDRVATWLSDTTARKVRNAAPLLLDRVDENLLEALSRTLVLAQDENKGKVARRLLRAIRWYNQATWFHVGANGSAELAVLSMGIAFEGLLAPKPRKLKLNAGADSREMSEALVAALRSGDKDKVIAALSPFIHKSNFLDVISPKVRAALGRYLQENRDPSETVVRNAVLSRLGVDTGVTENLKQSISGVLPGYEDERMRNDLMRWVGSFYALRSKIAHGSDVVSEDAHRYPGGYSSWQHVDIARRVFHAVLTRELCVQGFGYAPAGSRNLLLDMRDEISPVAGNSVRFDLIAEKVSRPRYDDADFVLHLRDLVRGIRLSDMDVTKEQLILVKRALSSIQSTHRNDDLGLRLLAEAARKALGDLALLDVLWRGVHRSQS